MDEGQSETDEERGRKLSKRIGTWLGVAASAAGVVAGVLLVVDRWGPKADFTVANWVRQANSSCAKSFGEKRELTIKVTAPLNAVILAPDTLPDDQFANRVAALVVVISEASGVERREAVDLDSIRRPKGHEAEVDQLVEKSKELSQKDAEFSLQLPNTARDETVQAVQAWIEERRKIQLKIGELEDQLGATECTIEEPSFLHTPAAMEPSRRSRSEL